MGNESSGNDLVVSAINQLTSRLEKNERDNSAHMQKMELRLEQIVDLMRTVSSLQTQISNHANDIVDIRSNMKEQVGKMDAAIIRLHTRMDDVTDKFNIAIETKIDLATVDFEKKLTATSVETEKVKTSITAIAEKSATHEKDWKQWFNRGWGVFFAFTLIFGFLNYVGNKWLDGLDRTVESTAAAVKKLDLKVTELENIVTRGGR